MGLNTLGFMVQMIPYLFVSYRLIQKWPFEEGISWKTHSVAKRYKAGLEAFRLDKALQSPIVCANLELCKQISLEKPVLLDFGCANGLYKILLANHTHTKEWIYVGADINPDLVEFCRAAYPNTRFEVSTSLFGDDEFDLTLASGVIQYIENWGNILKELKRVTKKFIMITRLPVWEYHESAIALQNVWYRGRREQHPLIILNRSEMQAEFARIGCTLSFEHCGGGSFRLPGVPETVVHSNFLFEVK